ncbi:MAG TPA: hypothetical protein VF092_29285 [Longimicrobium sp.]
MKLRLPLLAAAAVAVIPLHALAQRGTPAVTRLLAPLQMAAPMKQSLQTEMVRVFSGDGLAYTGPGSAYTVMGCEGTEMAAKLVDLNGDATPEVHVEAQGTCVGGMAGGFNWVFIRSASGAWRMNLNFNGGLYPLPSRALGFVDVMAGGPGFCHGIWRWNGRGYALLCIAGEGGQRCDNPCPRTLKTDEFGENLPAFTTSRSGAAG